MVVTEVAVFGQVKNRSLFVKLIVFVIVDFYEALSDEVHLLDIALVADDTFAGCRDATIHLDDKLICEASFALLKEMIERSLKLLEDASVLNKISLHFGCDLLVKLELLNDEVEIVQECLFNILADIVVKCWLDVEWLVRLLNFLDPHIKRVKLLLDEVIEVIGCVEDTIDGTHKERKECETQELQSYRENVLV